MAQQEHQHRTASQRSEEPLARHRGRGRAGFAIFAVALPILILAAALFFWSSELGDDTPPVDAPEIVE